MDAERQAEHAARERLAREFQKHLVKTGAGLRQFTGTGGIRPGTGFMTSGSAVVEEDPDRELLLSLGLPENLVEPKTFEDWWALAGWAGIPAELLLKLTFAEIQEYARGLFKGRALLGAIERKPRGQRSSDAQIVAEWKIQQSENQTLPQSERVTREQFARQKGLEPRELIRLLDRDRKAK